MESKKFTLYGFEYELFENGSLFVLRESGWTTVEPKYVRIKNGMYPRYALYEKGYDFTEENNRLIKKYEEALARFNAVRPSVWSYTAERGEIISDQIGDVVPPKPPTLYPKTGWRRFYMNHGSLVLKYWYGIEDERIYPIFIDGNTYNLAVSNIRANNWDSIFAAGRIKNKLLSEGVVNIIYANCGRYSTPYIAEALQVSETTVERVILGLGGYSTRGDRVSYAMNIRSSRGCFYNSVCYDWELDIDYINRVLCCWSNDNKYRQYLTKGNRGIRKGCGKMGFGLWVDKYGRSEAVSKHLIKKWVQLNQEYIDNVEELMEYIDRWSLGGDRCWSLERYDSYLKNNLYRMPEKVRVNKNVPCLLQNVGVDNRERTLWDLSDFQLVNLYDYCMGDFASIPTDSIKGIIDSFEDEPNWDDFVANGYESKEEFWGSYESLLGGGTLRDFRDAYKELLMSIRV